MPPLEDRVREAERALVQISKRQYQCRTSPPAMDIEPSAAAMHEKEEEEGQEKEDYPVAFLPLGVAEPPSLHSWQWLWGKGGRRRPLQYLIHKRVLKVSRWSGQTGHWA